MPRTIAGIELAQHIQQLGESHPDIIIKVLREGHGPRKMSAIEALTLVRAIAFVGVIAKSGKVRQIREAVRPRTEWRECWGTTQAAVLPPPIRPELFKKRV